MSQSSASQTLMGLSSKETVKKAGLNIWASGEDAGHAPEVDVIAVQGLGAHPYYTWVHRQTDIMWLRDLLPELIPHARIATYSYESDWRKVNAKTSVRECGEQLLNVLLQHRSEKERPLILIGHSLGGLIIKQALVLADHGETFSDIRLSMAGIIFLGTPHQGSDAAVYGVWLAWIFRHNGTLLESLKRDSSDLYSIALDFEQSYGNADIICFYEKQDGFYGPLRSQIVDHQSATLFGKRAMFLDTDHSGLNKFSGRNDENFLLMWPEIDRMVKAAPQPIEKRYASHPVNIDKAQRHQGRRYDQEAKLLQILGSDYKSDKNSVSKRIPGTCEWFFKDERFLEWRDSGTSRLLWVSAGPGCGKSVLARALIDERKVCTNTTPSTICYFFFKDGQEQRIRGVDALSALLHQLFENTDLRIHGLDEYERHGGELRSRFSELWEVLVKSVKDSKAGQVVCILDALDECEEIARNQLINQLVQFFSQEECDQNPLSRLKFLVTSRPYDDLELKFEQLSGVSTYIRFDGDEKSERIGQEIDLVIDAKIPHITGGFDDAQRERICNRLKEMENRTYLWLFLTIDIIEKSPSKFRRRSDIDSILSNLPSEISDAYEKILERSTDKVKARTLLEIIVAAVEPLSLEEANMALAVATREPSCNLHRDLELWPVENFGATVKNWCGLFVSVHNEALFLIHQTAREFLIRTSISARTHPTKWDGCLNMAAAHGTISRICLDYLSFQDLASFHQSQKDECYLINYAANNWAFHYKSQPAELARASRKVAMSLCNTSSSQGYWSSIYNGWRYRVISRLTELGVATWLGLTDVAEGFVEEGADVNAGLKSEGNALQIASARGYDQIVRLLLDRGADVNAQGRRHGNALQAASSRGHIQTIELLLDKGADINAQGGFLGNALQAASFGGHIQTIELLLDKGADINAQGGHYGNALQAASFGGHIQTIELLLDKRADINAQGGHYGNALQAASFGGHIQIIELLLDKGADINAQGGHYGNALQSASFSGHIQIIELLLDKGADINAQGGHYGNALQAASDVGHFQIVQMLLDRGSTDADGRALLAACSYKSGRFIQTKFNLGADDTVGRELEEASVKDRSQIVQMLLDKWGIFYAQGGTNGNALDIAVKGAAGKGHYRIVQMLIKLKKSAR